MKKEKDEAAFDSVDDIPTNRIDNAPEKHDRDKDASSPGFTSNCSFDTESMERGKTRKHHGKAIIIAACVGIALLLIGIFLFRCRNCCRRK